MAADLTEREQAILAREQAWRVERDQTAATAQTARTIGMLAMVDIGWRIWSRTSGPLDQVRTDGGGYPVGGIVLEVVDHVTGYNEDTGEITRVRAFRTIDPTSLRQRIITEAQVDPDAIELPDPYGAHVLISRLAALLAPKARKSLLEDADARLSIVADLHRLAVGARMVGP
jgi:hypothetical protein